MRKFSMLLTFAVLTIAAIGAQSQVSELWGANSQFDPDNWLKIDGNQFYNNIDSGWFRDDGIHFAGNQNYQTGYCDPKDCGTYYSYHGYFSFDLTGFAGNASSVSLKVNNFDVGVDSGTLVLYGTGLMPSDVDSQQNWNDIQKYEELNFGPVIGYITVTPNQSNMFSRISLTAAGIEWIDSHAERDVVIGTNWLVLPEPGNWLLLGTGLLGGIGMVRRRMLKASVDSRILTP